MREVLECRGTRAKANVISDNKMGCSDISAVLPIVGLGYVSNRECLKGLVLRIGGCSVWWWSSFSVTYCSCAPMRMSIV